MQDRFKLKFWDNTDKELGEVINIDFNTEFVDFKTKDGITSTPLKSGELIQCTGLKDKNGKLIYEGDIIKLNEKYPDYTAIDDFFKNQNYAVEFFQPQAKFLLKPSEYRDNSGDGICELSPDFYEFLNWDVNGIEYYVLQGIEVIGNAFENPELLEE